jgi:Peptidase family M28
VPPGRDPRGAIALVERNLVYHRSTQYLETVQAGAQAMLSISTAPGNLPQAGSIRRAWEASGPIPAVSIGAADGAIVRAALQAGQRVEAELAVETRVGRGRGQNVLGAIAGAEPHQLVIGAHYDTWFAGSTDNGGGVAALLELARRRAGRERPRYTIVFVAWDGEEVALYGGYDFLRRHRVAARAPILAVIDLETPSAHGAQAYGLARSAHAPLERAIAGAALDELFAFNVPMDFVPELFGGVIPTDIQGLYRAGTPAVSTAVDSPYYHTAGDTPDKVDLVRLADTVDGFDRALERLLDEPAERFAPRDPALWRLEVAAHGADGALRVDVTVVNHAGAPRVNALVEAVLLHDHFFPAAAAAARSDSTGRATLRLALDGELRRPVFLHVTAGDRHPLVEYVLAMGNAS